MPPRLAGLATCLAVVLLAAGARAERPAGTYALTIGGAAGVILPKGEVTCAEPGQTPTSCVTTTVATDPAGAITGTGHFTRTSDVPGSFSFDLEMSFEGRMSGRIGDPRGRSKVIAAGTIQGPPPAGNPSGPRETLDAEGEGVMECRLVGVSERLGCVTTLRLCTSLEGVPVDCGKFRFSHRVRAIRAPLDLDFDLATDDRGHVTGTATLAVGENPVEFDAECSAEGKFSRAANRSTLRLASEDPVVKLVFKKTDFDGGELVGGRVLYQLGGQKGRVEITPPPEPEP